MRNCAREKEGGMKMASSFVMTTCSGCDEQFKYKELFYCGQCDGWYCEDCYTEDADHECLSDMNENEDEDDNEDEGKRP